MSSRERLMQIDYLLNLHNRAATTVAAWTGPREILGDDSWAVDDAPPMPSDAIWMGNFNFQPDSAEYTAIAGAEDTIYGHVSHVDRFADSWTAAGNGRDDRESYPPSDGRDATHLDYCFVSPSFAGRVRSSHVDREADGSDYKPVWVDIDLSTGGLP
ncbi:MAG: hypothetical protein VCB77_00430 [Alphaproteobacteria bacterium]